MVKPEDKNATPFIIDYKEYHTGGWVRGAAWLAGAVTVLLVGHVGPGWDSFGAACRPSSACGQLAEPLASSHPPAPADTTVNFRVTLSEAKMREALAAGLLDKFKLRSKISTGAGRLWRGGGPWARAALQGQRAVGAGLGWVGWLSEQWPHLRCQAVPQCSKPSILPSILPTLPPPHPPCTLPLPRQAT